MLKTEEEMRDIRCCGPEGCGELRKVAEPKTIDRNSPSYGVLTAQQAEEERKTQTRTARFCIASKCAAWEWHYEIPMVKDVHGLQASDLSKPPECTDKGYCGLARYSGTS